MFGKIGCWFHNLKCDVKNAFLKTKWHFYILFGMFLIALLCVIAANYKNCSYSGNFMQSIAEGGNFPFWAAIWKLCGIFASFALLIIASVNFYFYMVGYIGFAVLSYYWLYAVICAVLSCGAWGWLYILLFLIPVGLIWMFCYAMALYQIYRTVIFGTGRCFTNLLRCNRRLIFRMIAPFCLLVIGCALILWLIESIVFFILF